MRRAAVETLGGLEPAALARHAGAIAEMLGDTEKHVRAEAAEALGKLPRATVSLHTSAAADALKDPRGGLRSAEAQGMLEPTALAQHTVPP